MRTKGIADAFFLLIVGVWCQLLAVLVWSTASDIYRWQAGALTWLSLSTCGSAL